MMEVGSDRIFDVSGDFFWFVCILSLPHIRSLYIISHLINSIILI